MAPLCGSWGSLCHKETRDGRRGRRTVTKGKVSEKAGSFCRPILGNVLGELRPRNWFPVWLCVPREILNAASCLRPTLKTTGLQGPAQSVFSVFILSYSQPCSGHADLLTAPSMPGAFCSLGAFSQTPQKYPLKWGLPQSPYFKLQSHTHTRVPCCPSVFPVTPCRGSVATSYMSAPSQERAGLAAKHGRSGVRDVLRMRPLSALTALHCTVSGSSVGSISDLSGPHPWPRGTPGLGWHLPAGDLPLWHWKKLQQLPGAPRAFSAGEPDCCVFGSQPRELPGLQPLPPVDCPYSIGVSCRNAWRYLLRPIGILFMQNDIVQLEVKWKGKGNENRLQLFSWHHPLVKLLFISLQRIKQRTFPER